MASREVDDIAALVDASVEFYQPRTDIFRDLLDMYTMPKDLVGAGEIDFKDSIAHAAVKVASAILTRKRPVVTVLPTTEQKEEKERAARVEQVYHGVLDELNRLAFLNGRGMTWDYENVFNMMAFGWVATRVYVTEGEENKSPFRFCRHFWPGNVFPGPFTDEGPEWVVHRYRGQAGALAVRYPDWAKENYDEAQPYAELEVHDFYDKEDNYVIIEAELAEQKAHNQGELPWIVTPVAGHNFRGSPDDQRTFTDTMGMAFTYGIRDLWAYYNELMEALGAIVKKFAKPTVIVKTRDGSVRHIELGAGTVNTLYLTDIVEVIQVPGAPPDVVVMLQAVVSAMQRVTFQETVYGNPPTGLSGFALTLVSHHAGLTLEPYVELLKIYDREVGRRLLKGIERFELDSTFAGENSRGELFRLQDFSYTEINGRYDIWVDRKLSLPEDDLIRTQIAIQSTQAPAPLLSLETAREKLLLIEDPLKEAKRIIAEAPYRLPEVVLALAYQELIDRGDQGAAALLAAKLGIGGGGLGTAAPAAGSNLLPPALTPGQQVSPAQAAMQGGQAGQGFFPQISGFQGA